MSRNPYNPCANRTRPDPTHAPGFQPIFHTDRHGHPMQGGFTFEPGRRQADGSGYPEDFARGARFGPLGEERDGRILGGGNPGRAGEYVYGDPALRSPAGVGRGGTSGVVGGSTHGGAADTRGGIASTELVVHGCPGTQDSGDAQVQRLRALEQSMRELQASFAARPPTASRPLVSAQPRSTDAAAPGNTQYGESARGLREIRDGVGAVGGGGPRVMYPHADGRLREYPEGGGIRGEVVYDAQGRATGLRRRRGERKGKH